MVLTVTLSPVDPLIAGQLGQLPPLEDLETHGFRDVRVNVFFRSLSCSSEAGEENQWFPAVSPTIQRQTDGRNCLVSGSKPVRRKNWDCWKKKKRQLSLAHVQSSGWVEVCQALNPDSKCFVPSSVLIKIKMLFAPQKTQKNPSRSGCRGHCWEPETMQGYWWVRIAWANIQSDTKSC